MMVVKSSGCRTVCAYSTLNPTSAKHARRPSRPPPALPRAAPQRPPQHPTRKPTLRTRRALCTAGRHAPTCCSVASGSTSSGTPALHTGQLGSFSYLAVCVYRPVLPTYLCV